MDKFDRLPYLESLVLENCKFLKSLGGLAGATSLTKVALVDCPGIETLKFLANIPSLRRLLLPGSVKLASTKEDQPPPKVGQDLTAIPQDGTREKHGMSRVLEDLGGLEALEELNLAKWQELSSLEGIQQLQSLKRLNIEFCTGL
ncbi:MAG: hypothetical protein JNG86_22120, partial [Verrucomicrobiaceae bacterium]|nr:hypothetical protein [Verrucomicrobiaceae bacterium]